MPRTVKSWPPWDSHEPLPNLRSEIDPNWCPIDFYRDKKYEKGHGHTLKEITGTLDCLVGKDDLPFVRELSSINVVVDWPGYPPFNRVVTTVVDGRQITRLELLCRVADIVKLFFAFVQQRNLQVEGPGLYHRYTVPGMPALECPETLPDIWGHLQKREGEVIITRLTKLNGSILDWLVEIYVPVPYAQWIHTRGGTWSRASGA